MWSRSAEFFNPYQEIMKEEFNRKARGKHLSITKNMVIQKVLGLLLIVICVVMIAFSTGGETPEDRDATFILLLCPLGVYLLFSNNLMIDL